MKKIVSVMNLFSAALISATASAQPPLHHHASHTSYLAHSTKNTSLFDLTAITEKGLRLAIRDPKTGAMTYTKDGSFIFKDGYFYQNNMRLQGYPTETKLTETICITTDITAYTTIPPKATTQILFNYLNLNAETAFNDHTFDPNDVRTYNYQGYNYIYDSLGSRHQVEFYFTKAAINSWTVYIYMYGTQLTKGTLTFNANGRLASATNLTHISFTPTTGASEIEFDVDFSQDVSQFATNNSYSSIQDGYAIGSLEASEVDGNGYVLFEYSNGVEIKAAKLAVSV